MEPAGSFGNPAQKKAISHLDGPMMVLAGPGSGKTSVIARRTAYMTGEGGIPGSHILVVTFSRMAARQMRERFLSLIGEPRSDVTFGTFHGIFYGILKAAYGFTAANILSGEEKMQILKGILVNEGREEAVEGDFLEDISREISLVKGQGIAVEHYHSTCCPDELFGHIYEKYAAALSSRHKLDFDDMIVGCYELLKRREDILAAWRDKFRYILVDEFQDISPMQYTIVRLLAAPRDNLFIVGDDDQSIYHFRGANPEIMLHFEKDYPGAKKVLLNVNYRCTQNILTTALDVVENNKHRFPKELSTPNPEGAPVAIRIYPNPREMAWQVAALLKKRQEEGKALEDSAVLVRTNQEAESLVGALLSREIPFTMRDRLPNMFSHWICRDLLAYMEMAEGEILRSLFLTVANRPNRYISREAIAFASLKGAGGKMLVNFSRLREFYRDKRWMVERLDKMWGHLSHLKGMPPYAAVNYIRKEIGYEEYLAEYAVFRRCSPEDLVSVLDRLTDSARKLASLGAWKDHMEKYTLELAEQAKRQDRKPEGVTVATLHSVKGLEYDAVFIINVNEGSIPYRKAILPEAIEEERRLFYVGMTRAKKELNLCFARKDNEKELAPSRFLMEAGYHTPAAR